MIERAEAFLELFNKLEKQLNQLLGTTEYFGFRRLVTTLSKRNGIINEYKQDLIEYSELRNAIVHKSTGQVIAEPNPETVEQLRRIYEMLAQPPGVMEIAATPVYTCDTNDYVLDVVRTMKTRSYAYVPVLHDERFIGVFSEHTLMKWIAQMTEEMELAPARTTIGQLHEFFDRPDDKVNGYRFVSQDTDVYTVRQHFLSFTKEEKRLGSIFVTKSGERHEPIVGIVTAWDLPKISRFFNDQGQDPTQI